MLYPTIVFVCRLDVAVANATRRAGPKILYLFLSGLALVAIKKKTILNVVGQFGCAASKQIDQSRIFFVFVICAIAIIAINGRTANTRTHIQPQSK